MQDLKKSNHEYMRIVNWTNGLINLISQVIAC